jgi:integrase
MSMLSAPTLTEAEQRAILRASAVNPRDHLIYSLALGTGLRLAEIVGLNVGDAFFPDGRPRARVRIRREIAKGGRQGDVFLPDSVVHEPSEDLDPEGCGCERPRGRRRGPRNSR